MTTPAMTLRPYQEDAIRAVLAARARGQTRQLLSLPPGAGKTVIFATLIDRLGGRAIVLAHRDELIGQAAEKLRMLAPHLSVGIVQAARNETDADVLVCSVPTLAQAHRRALLPRDVGVVVADECHHAPAATWRTVLEHLHAGDHLGPLLIGVTASPDRADGLGLDALFSPEPVYSLSLLDLIDQGYLCPLTARRVFYQADFTRLETRHGDVTAASAEAAFLAGGGPEAVRQAIAREAADRRSILVFTSGVLSAEQTAARLGQAGIGAAAVHGKHALEERRAILERFRAGDLRVLVNCQILTEGADFPATDCVVLARPTQSRALYLQMCGRGFRLHPAKHDCLLLDLTANTSKHALVSPASLVGLRPEDVEPGENLSGAVARKRQRTEAAAAGDVSIHTAHVELFQRRNATWIPAPGGRYLLNCGKAGQIIIQPEDPQGRHWAILGHQDGQTDVLREGLTIDYAQGLGEAFARRRGAAHLIRRDARWRNDPASDGQLWRLRKERIPLPQGKITKGIAHDLIAAADAAKLAPALR